MKLNLKACCLCTAAARLAEGTLADGVQDEEDSDIVMEDVQPKRRNAAVVAPAAAPRRTARQAQPAVAQDLHRQLQAAADQQRREAAAAQQGAAVAAQPASDMQAVSPLTLSTRTMRCLTAAAVCRKLMLTHGKFIGTIAA